jgi:hypothetical protein
MLLVSTVAYFVEQACSFKLEGRLVLTDNEPAQMLSRFAVHRSERVLRPPPLVLRTYDGTYLVHRRREPGAFERIERHTSLARAIVSWVRHVHEERGGTLFLNRKLGTFAPAFLGQEEAASGSILLSTVALA